MVTYQNTRLGKIASLYLEHWFFRNRYPHVVFKCDFLKYLGLHKYLVPIDSPSMLSGRSLGIIIICTTTLHGHPSSCEYLAVM